MASVDRARAMYEEAWQSFKAGNVTDSLKTVRSLLRIADLDTRIKAFRLLGEICLKQDNREKAKKFLQSALASVGEDSLEKAQILNKLGLIELYEKNYPAAIEYQEKCLAVTRTLGNPEALAVTYQNLGSLYTRVGDHVKALRHHRESLRLKRQLDDVLQVAKSLEAYAEDLEMAGELDHAVEKFQELVQIYTKLKKPEMIARFEDAIDRIYNMIDEDLTSPDYDSDYRNML